MKKSEMMTDARAVRALLELTGLDMRMPDWAFDQVVAASIRARASVVPRSIVAANPDGIFGPKIMLDTYRTLGQKLPRGMKARIEAAHARVRSVVVERILRTSV